MTAYLRHFSQLAIGEGLSARGDILPSLKGINSDRFTGAANLSYPLAMPKGLGGLTPQLSLSYSSSAVDDVIHTGGDDDYKVQAGYVGYGWSLGGISYIDRSEIGGSGESQGFYSLVLNGMRSTINGGRDNPVLETNYFTRIRSITAGGAGAFDGWEVTGTDGTLYRFGGLKPSDEWPITERGRNTPIAMYLGPNQANLRKFEKWYLSEVIDPLGNRMTFQYEAQRGDIQNWANCGNDPGAADKAWYTRSVLPTEILWSSNPSQNAPAMMRARFVYTEYVDGIERPDKQVPGYNDDCLQPHYTTKRLAGIVVEVRTASNPENWHILQEYVLSQSNFSGPGHVTAENNALHPDRHLLLDQLETYGQGGVAGGLAALQSRENFTYSADLSLTDGENDATTKNNIRLTQATNSGGGAIEFVYGKDQMDVNQCPPEVCPDDDKRYRFFVSQMVTHDGLGKRMRTVYTYERPLMRGEYDNEEILQEREFMGFRSATATTYDAAADALAGAELKYEEFSFYQTFPDNAAPTAPRDPRQGKLKTHKTWSPPVAQCYNGQERAANGRCLFAYNQESWAALVLNNGQWTGWGSETSGPFWVRQERSLIWADGAQTVKEYLYDANRQHVRNANGNWIAQQLGNITDVKEYEVVGATAPITNLLRTTTTEFYTNLTKNIINLPAQIIVDNPDGSCASESRTIYADPSKPDNNWDGNYRMEPQSGLVVRTEQLSHWCGGGKGYQIANTDSDADIMRFAYDAFGNQTTAQRLGDASVGDDTLYTSYDATYHLFPIEQHLGQDQAYQETGLYYGVNGPGLDDWRAYWGALAEHCAANGLCTRQAYDAWGRPTFRWEKVAAGAPWGSNTTQETDKTSAQTRWDYRDPLHDPGFVTTSVNEWHAPRCEGNFVRRHYNGLGQLVAEQKPDQNWALSWDGCTRTSNDHEIDVLYAYDGLGRQVRVATPQRVSGDYRQRIVDIDWNTIWQSRPHTLTLLDVLDRPKRTLAPNGQTTRYSYLARATSTVDEGASSDPNDDKVVKWQELDGLGRPRYLRTYAWNTTAQRWDQEGQVILVHNTRGDLTCVYHPYGTTDPATNPNCNSTSNSTTKIYYDQLGRKTTLDDPDLGHQYYKYDRQGHLIRQYDVRNNQTCLYYDALGRLKGKVYIRTWNDCPTAPTTYNVRFDYDQQHSASNRSRGQVTTVTIHAGVNIYTSTTSSPTYVKQLRYDGNGQLAHEIVSIQGANQPFTTSFGYDAWFRPSTVQYPGNTNEVVTTTYNSMGLPKTLHSSEHGLLVDGAVNGGAAYDEAGRLTAMRFPAGGNLWRTQSYAPWNEPSPNGGLLTAIQVGTQTNPGARLNLAYSYDHFGNVATLTDNGTPHSFAYDAQNRLTQAYGREYAYDNAGRLTYYEGARLKPDVLHPHAVVPQEASDCCSRYDYNGNPKYRTTAEGGVQGMTWDHENRLTAVFDGSSSYNKVLEQYIYDAEGIRVKKSSADYGTYYVNQYYEVDGVEMIGGGSNQWVSNQWGSNQLVSASASQWISETVDLSASGIMPRLFLPWVSSQNADGVAGIETPAAVEAGAQIEYRRAETGEPCAAGSAGCLAFQVDAASATVAPPLADLSHLAAPAPLTPTFSITQMAELTASALMPERLGVLLPSDVSGVPPQPSIVPSDEVQAAAVLTVTNASMNLTTTNNVVLGWSGVRADTTNYPATAVQWGSSGVSQGHSGAAYAVSNLANGWLETSSALAVSAGQSYNLRVAVQGAFDPDDYAGTWGVRITWFNNSVVVTTTTPIQGAAADLAPTLAQTRTVSVTVPSGVNKAKVALVNTLNAGWIAFGNVSLQKVGTTTELVTNGNFTAQSSSGAVSGWSSYGATAYPATSFYHVKPTANVIPPIRLTPFHIQGFANNVYVISNLAYGWLQSQSFAVQAGYTYALSFWARGELDRDEGSQRMGDAQAQTPKCVGYLQFYDQNGQALSAGAGTYCPQGPLWQQASSNGLAPAQATKAVVVLVSAMNAGWVTFDDVEAKSIAVEDVTGIVGVNGPNLLPNPGFESASGWDKKYLVGSNGQTVFKGTGFERTGQWLSAGRNGGYGYTIHNLAYGYAQSPSVAVQPGRTYKVGAWLRGQIDDEESEGRWAVHVRFYDSTGAALAYPAEAIYGFASQLHPVNWQQVTGMVPAPGNAASLKLELWSARSGGWVAFDDVSLESKPLGSGRYYYFGGQRIAMMTDSQLKYLHTDHLGSTYLVTDGQGNPVDSAPRYAAYGHERIPGSVSALPTEYAFTGQRQDNRTGLVYMNARYYDPDLGIFISPDTIIPDPTNVMDYNRYMYVRGNPMKYNDPTGHYLESWWDVANVGMGVASLGYNLWNGNYSDAAWDAGGLVVDLAATAIPIIPGGAATALKLGRAADAVVSVASHADEVMDVAKYANKADDAGDLAKQLDNLPCPIQNSFSAETPVLTAKGLKPISQLMEEELVYAWNETNQRLELQPIVDTISHHDPAIVLLTLTGERLATTADHPFYVLESAPWLVAGERRGRWVAAGALQPGDTLWQADGETGEVLAVRIVEQPQQMYNLTVAVAHTFFVGQQHWLVHNCKKGGRYKELDTDNGKYERHHTPADSVSPFSTENGPSILLEVADHKKTASWGRSKAAQAYRAIQQELIDLGLFDDAVQMDIDDVLQKFGDKYSGAILEMIDSLK